MIGENCLVCNNKPLYKCPECLKIKTLKAAMYCSHECAKSDFERHGAQHESKAGFQGLQNKMKKFEYTGKLRPGIVIPSQPIPNEIARPDYAAKGIPKSELVADKLGRIPKTLDADKIDITREAGALGREALDLAHSLIKPGITTEEIDRTVHEFIISRDAYPSPKNYYNFPKSLCTSVNEVICHGIPDNRILQEGDIVNVDITVYHKGVHSDLNETFAVGQISPEAKTLIKAAHDSLMHAISKCKPGLMYKQVGSEIQAFLDDTPYSIVRSYTGHGVGKLFHCPPIVSHYSGNKDVGIMEPGHMFTIEPMINVGNWRDTTWPDKWTATTIDGSLSAQFEHTLLVNESGVEILTKRQASSPPLCFE